jgi:hypothetical protein
MPFKYITQLDVASAYHTIKWEMADNLYVYFTWNNERYYFKKLQFGLLDAPTKYCAIMDSMFNHLQYVLCYFDNILIVSEDYPNHLQHIKQVLAIVNQYNLPINWEKSQLLCHYIFGIYFVKQRHCYPSSKG